MKASGENPLKAPIRKSWLREEEENIKKALEILVHVGLHDYWDYEAFRLGGAQLKMLEIARALAVGAKLIALDEPIGGVDPVYAKDILSYVRRLKENLGLSFILIEHRIDIALPFADYVYVMDRGRIIAEGPPNEIANNPKVIDVYIG
jgi:branched-chain amino acid transport system ATP-binding protein